MGLCLRRRRSREKEVGRERWPMWSWGNGPGGGGSDLLEAALRPLLEWWEGRYTKRIRRASDGILKNLG